MKRVTRWLRRDFRVTDNTAAARAAKGESFSGVFRAAVPGVMPLARQAGDECLRHRADFRRADMVFRV